MRSGREEGGAAIGRDDLLVAFAPFALWSPHFETDLEIIQNHADAGGRVVVLSCDGQLKTCEPNPEHRALVCRACQGRFRSGMRWLQGPAISHQTFHDLTADEALQVESLRTRAWTDLEEVRAFRLDGTDVGLAAISSVVSWSREPSPDVGKFAKAIGDNVASAAMVYFSLSRKLTGLGASAISLCNGRVAALRPALRAAQKLGVTAYVHERAGYADRYALTTDTYPHDLAAIKSEIERLVPETGFTQAQVRSARGWYEERRAGIAQSWISFVAGQDRGAVPDEIHGAARKVAIFVSSEDEFVAIEEWNNPFYPSQNEGIESLLSAFESDSRVRFFLREHPNMAGLDNSQLDGIHALARRFPRLVVIDASSPVSSYALIDAVDLVITFGSTIGVEACYAGKPSVLMGRAMYEDLGVCLKPVSHAALVQIVEAVTAGNAPAPPEGSAFGLEKFGHYNRLGGRAFRHLQPHGLFNARMQRGDQLTAIRPGGVVNFIFKAARFADGMGKRLFRRQHR